MSDAYTYKLSRRDAPLGLCPDCLKYKRDWGFRYHRACSKCFGKQQSQRVAEFKKLGQYNKNVELGSGTVVTEFVKKRLRKKAERNVPHTAVYNATNVVMTVSCFLPIVAIFIDTANSHRWGALQEWFIFLISIFTMCYMIYLFLGEQAKHESAVKEEINNLARHRQANIEVAKLFYGSPEWKLLREQIMSQHKNICVTCGKTLKKAQVTIDHILPRSKYPEKALDVANMQILCRPCNSSKGARVWGL